MKKILLVIAIAAIGLSCSKDEIGTKICNCETFREHYYPDGTVSRRSNVDKFVMVTPADQDCSVNDYIAGTSMTIEGVLIYRDGVTKCD